MAILIGTTLRFTLAAYPRLRCSLAASWRTGDLVLGEHLLHICLGGAISATISGKNQIIPAGSALLITAGTPFHLAAHGGRVRTARVRISGVTLTRSHYRWDGIQGIETVLALLEERLLDQHCTAAEHLALASLLEAALTRPGHGNPALAARLRQRVADDPTCTPTDLARNLGLSHDYATRRIRAATGLPPRTFILRERLRLAADRLAAGDASWQAICADLGWRDDKLFLRQFRRAFGQPPGRWRSRLA